MQYSNVSILTTNDGFYTLKNNDIGETYHSMHGSLNEAKHVFLNMGLIDYLTLNPDIKEISIFEVGFGSGLNFLITADYCISKNIRLNYNAIEAYPIHPNIIESIDFNNVVINSYIIDRYKLEYHNIINNKQLIINDLISLSVIIDKIENININTKADIIYFDAFSPSSQSEMWDDTIINKVANCINKNGSFVTYSITGKLKRQLRSLGFKIEKLPGAPGKREMLRAKLI